MQQQSRTGLAALIVSIVLCALSHLLLRDAAADNSSSPPLDLILNWRIILGLGIYGTGTLLWLYCLRKIDLSLAFPGSALQLILVLSGASYFLSEQLSPLQMTGSALILAGIAVLFSERRQRRA